LATIKEVLNFNFDGQSSSSFKLVHINLDNGMFEEIFAPSREIVENKVAGNPKPYFNKVELSPREFDLNLGFVEEYTDDLIDRIIRWLFVDYYKPLYFVGKEHKVFYCMPVGDSSIVHNGLKNGYLTIRMRCDSPYIYSPMYNSGVKDVVTHALVKLPNKGHFEIAPQISIKKIGIGDITIKNSSDDGTPFIIKNLIDGEGIFIDCEKEIIHTDIVGKYRYDDIEGDFFNLIYGENNIEIYGDCQIEFRYQYKFKF